MIYLGYGSKGPNVLAWQRFLNARPTKDILYHASESGEFDMETERATMAFQRMHGLDADGCVGPATLAKSGLALRGEPEPPLIRRTSWERILETD